MSVVRATIEHRYGPIEVWRDPMSGRVIVQTAGFKLGVSFERDGTRLILTPEAPVNGVTWNGEPGRMGRMIDRGEIR